jgi:tellurite resistance protein TehA-like permease
MRGGLPFSLTWWSFTFPVGTVVTGTAALGAQTGAAAFTWLAACTFALLLAAWAVAFVNTARGAWTGALLLPPPSEARSALGALDGPRDDRAVAVPRPGTTSPA